MLTEEAVRRYVENFLTPEQPVLSRIRDAVTASGLEHEEIRKSQLAFLQCVIAAQKPKLILELGTFFGYSTLGMAMAVRSHCPGAKILSVDQDAERSAQAKSFIDQAGFSDLVSMIVAKDREFLDELRNSGQYFDFIFLDTSEMNYSKLYPLCIDRLCPGGTLMVDNALMLWARDWSTGKNIIESNGNGEIRALSECVKLAFTDHNVVTSLIPIGVGMLFCVKKGARFGDAVVDRL